jgi:hypothetical protein
MQYQSQEGYNFDFQPKEQLVRTTKELGIKKPENPTTELHSSLSENRNLIAKYTGNPFMKCDFNGCWGAVEKINSSVY